MKKTFYGILIGFAICGVVFYFRTIISEQGPPFLIGALLSIIIVFLMVFILSYFLKEKFNLILTFTKRVNENNENYVEILSETFPGIDKNHAKVIEQIIKRFLWSRSAYMIMGVVFSVFIAIGGLLGSVLIFKQNSIIERQTIYMKNQNNLLSDQNISIDNQNKLLNNQNKLVNTQTSLFSIQNALIRDQTDILNLQIEQTIRQNKLYEQELQYSIIERKVLEEQNKLIKGQSDLLNTQNKLIAIQDSLIVEQLKVEIKQNEFENLSTLAYNSAHLNSQLELLIDEILNNEIREEGTNKRSIPDRIIEKISSFSNYCTPYKPIDFKEYGSYYSPERGKLFLFIIRRNYSRDINNKIFGLSNFSYSILDNVNMSQVNLTNANLEYSTFRNANLSNSSIRFSNLSNCDFSGANFNNTDLRGSILDKSVFGRSRKTCFDNELSYYIIGGESTDIVTMYDDIEGQIGCQGAYLGNLKNKDFSINYSSLEGAQIDCNIEEFSEGFEEKTEDYILTNFVDDGHISLSFTQDIITDSVTNWSRSFVTIKLKD